MVHQPGAQVRKEMPTAHQPASSAGALLAAQLLVSQLPLGQGLPPSLHSLLPQAHTLGLLFWPLHRQVPPERWEERGLGLLRREWVGQH